MLLISHYSKLIHYFIDRIVVHFKVLLTKLLVLSLAHSWNLQVDSDDAR